jgi:hypothetical protein
MQLGPNGLVLTGIFASDTELESVYVVGPFGVAARRLGEEGRHTGQVFDRYAPEFRLVAPPQRAEADWMGRGLAVDLTAQGLPFFAGRATLRQTVSLPAFEGRAELALEGLHAAVAHVRVNGHRSGTVAWPPHQVAIPTGLHGGENVIEVELVGTLRNLLGPHHRRGGDTAYTSPRDFRSRDQWIDDYILVPFGFDGAVLRLFES